MFGAPPVGMGGPPHPSAVHPGAGLALKTEAPLWPMAAHHHPHVPHPATTAADQALAAAR